MMMQRTEGFLSFLSFWRRWMTLLQVHSLNPAFLFLLGSGGSNFQVLFYFPVETLLECIQVLGLFVLFGFVKYNGDLEFTKKKRKKERKEGKDDHTFRLLIWLVAPRFLLPGGSICLNICGVGLWYWSKSSKIFIERRGEHISMSLCWKEEVIN